YRLAASTGLRYSEIASITPASFDWEGPSVRVAAAYTKNRQEAELPLPNDLADDLRPYVAALATDSPVFPLPAMGAEMLRADLEAAGIPYRDASGLFFDFHSLRCQTATLADAAGISPRVVQRLMRHSSLELTGRYTKPRAVDIDAAASRLPSLRPTGDRTEGLALTGTDGPCGHRQPSDLIGPAASNTEKSGVEGQPISERFGHYLATGGTFPGGMCRVQA
ncbi:MAG: site-specific integrase, partial [Isosphaeraceae bacterium]